MSDGYVFNAATNLLQPKQGRHPSHKNKRPGAPRQREVGSLPCACHVTITPHGESRVAVSITSAAHAVYETPLPSIAAAFLAKTSKPSARDGSAAAPPKPPMSPPLESADDALQLYSTDLVPYYLCQYELQGMAISAHRVPRDAPPPPPGTSLAMLPGFAKLAKPLLKEKRSSLKDVADDEIRVEMRAVEEVMRLACEAHLSKSATTVSLHELMYDDAFVHSLVVRALLLLTLHCRSGPHVRRLPRTCRLKSRRLCSPKMSTRCGICSHVPTMVICSHQLQQ
jgi:hypothetical protein